MGHVYEVQSLVELPKCTANAASTIGTQLLAAADREKKLTPPVGAAVDRIRTSTGGLQEAIRGSFGQAGDATHFTESRAEATTWSALESWLSGIARAPMASAATAQNVYNELFGGGLLFLRLPTAERWAQTDARLVHIKKEKLDVDFAALGGTEFLTTLRATHAAAGEAAGITVPRSAMPTVIGSAFDVWKGDAKSLVAQVVAMADHERTPAAYALAARLLDALATYEPPRSTVADAPTPPTPPAPALDAAATPAPATPPVKTKT